ncbi:PilD-dependent protein PddA [Limihaloglobus sulfuriphilus]|uniref:PilD-dependent protein PddA n=1 Tax=Limihaloglobus sulfuriphilus TaxID=1851148 RepID=A0A1Q2MCD3_9BACT|nr:type II secretion system protein [Limihaloglobus sulfuriphilus]AQQ69902.1 PilD-dependent protein PddA [Limihaloglobus sulfuriphilus]
MAKKVSKGFTLIELLVVISIIALLMAILMPALSKVREQAKSVVCQSRMRQYGLALHAYSTSNSDIIPYFATYCPTTDKPPSGVANVYWYEALAPYISINEDSSKGSKHESEAFTTELRTCPASTRQSPIRIGVNFCWDGKTSPFYYGHYYGKEYPHFKMSKVKNTASAMAYMDCGGLLGPDAISHWVYNPRDPGMGFVDDYDRNGVKDSIISYGGAPRPFNYGNPKAHYGGCNVTLLDGHVERVQYEDLWEDQERLGRAYVPKHPFWKLD